MIDKFNSILAALKLSMAKFPIRMGRGKYPNTEEGRKRFIQDYVNRYFDGTYQDETSTVKSDFLYAVRHDPYLAEKVYEQFIGKDAEKFAKIAEELGYLQHDRSCNDWWEIFYKLEDKYEAWDVINYILNNGMDDDTTYESIDEYQNFLMYEDRQLRLDVRDRLIEEAEEQFDEGLDSDNVSIRNETYDQLFHGKDRIIPNELKFTSDALHAGDGAEFNKEFQRLAIKYFKMVKNFAEADALEAAIQNGDKLPDYYNIGEYHFLTKKDRVIRVGKVLADLNRKFQNQIDIMEMMKKLSQKESSSKNNKYVIVISRHPYDIAGMSTGRGWRSCMNLVNGQYNQYVVYSIKGNVLIAYLCKEEDTTDIVDSKGIHHKNDKINIQHPLGRVLIKPYFKKNDDGSVDESSSILRCSTAYGTFYPEAIKNLQYWLDYNWNQYMDKNNSSYVFDDEHFYQEWGDTRDL